ncbi:ATP:cob(I)alamin adenosyltransferase [Candidatus Peregrinibacteria bacterium CG11_big_fil_rev_8_21_14_0_20_46_8]|nr:MAG: ATP:cob(I)alamin adenosyltransferase [Candidatus Peregrinibacteria bacterium CG11_big_fil_rev_8_21_14_0_20_46_8]
MHIYTKSGDKGQTGLVGGQRVDKDTVRIECIGAVDELNAALGVCMVHAGEQAHALLTTIQHTLFNIGAELADPEKKTGLILEAAATQKLEDEIDKREALLPPLREFILPSGPPFAANLHFARTLCRRAERQLVKLQREAPQNPHLLTYLNRLSDLLFILAREDMERAKIKPQSWQK